MRKWLFIGLIVSVLINIYFIYDIFTPWGGRAEISRKWQNELARNTTLTMNADSLYNRNVLLESDIKNLSDAFIGARRELARANNELVSAEDFIIELQIELQEFEIKKEDVEVSSTENMLQIPLETQANAFGIDGSIMVFLDSSVSAEMIYNAIVSVGADLRILPPDIKLGITIVQDEKGIFKSLVDVEPKGVVGIKEYNVVVNPDIFKPPKKSNFAVGGGYSTLLGGTAMLCVMYKSLEIGTLQNVVVHEEGYSGSSGIYVKYNYFPWKGSDE